MISDTLNDAIEDIENYLDKEPEVYKGLEALIRGLLLDMKSVQKLCESQPKD